MTLRSGNDFLNITPNQTCSPAFPPATLLSLTLKTVHTQIGETGVSGASCSLRSLGNKKKHLSFLQSQCHSFGSYVHQAAGPCLVTPSFCETAEQGKKTGNCHKPLENIRCLSHSIAMHCRPPPFTKF